MMRGDFSVTIVKCQNLLIWVHHVCDFTENLVLKEQNVILKYCKLIYSKHM